MKKNSQSGIALFAVITLVFIVVIGVGAGYVVYKNNTKETKQNENGISTTDSNKSNIAFTEWSFNGTSWNKSQGAPDCNDPIIIQPPTDLSAVTSKLLPGQYRGGNYKAHGGLANDTATDNKLNVYAVYDGFLYRGVRYIESGEVQYLFDFMNSCGVLYRLDHLSVLTDEFMKYANMLPEAKENESRTTKFENHPFIKAGTLIATEVGFKNSLNVGFDLGVYDLRTQNEASKSSEFTNDSGRSQNKELPYYGLCWFNNLMDSDKAIVDALPNRDSNQKSSDYCD